MCTIICTVRTVLWYITSLAGTLLILLALFNTKWLEGSISESNIANTNSLDSVISLGKDIVTNVKDGIDVTKREVGLFFHCKNFMDKKFFDGECVPEWDKLENLFKEWDDDKYPHPWRGAIICFALGLALMVLTDLFALLTVCCRSCICCSVFTICGSIQSFAGILFTLGKNTALP